MAGPVINEYILGNYLIYKLHPRITVSMDSRIDAYGERLHRQYLAAAEGSPRLYPGAARAGAARIGEPGCRM